MPFDLMPSAVTANPDMSRVNTVHASMLIPGRIFEQPPTTQQLFNHVVNHLFAQRAKSKHAIERDSGFNTQTFITFKAICAYRGDYDRKCAIGALIHDDNYHWALEGKGVQNPQVVEAVEKSISRCLSRYEINMLEELQHIHDKESVQTWPHKLAKVAHNFSLAFKPS